MAVVVALEAEAVAAATMMDFATMASHFDLSACNSISFRFNSVGPRQKGHGIDELA